MLLFHGKGVSVFFHVVRSGGSQHSYTSRLARFMGHTSRRTIAIYHGQHRARVVFHPHRDDLHLKGLNQYRFVLILHLVRHRIEGYLGFIGLFVANRHK